MNWEQQWELYMTTSLKKQTADNEKSPLCNSLCLHLQEYYNPDITNDFKTNTEPTGLPSPDDLDRVMEEEKIKELTNACQV